MEAIMRSVLSAALILFLGSSSVLALEILDKGKKLDAPVCGGFLASFVATAIGATTPTEPSAAVEIFLEPADPDRRFAPGKILPSAAVTARRTAMLVRLRRPVPTSPTPENAASERPTMT